MRAANAFAAASASIDEEDKFFSYYSVIVCNMHCILVDDAKICKNICTLQCMSTKFTKKIILFGEGRPFMREKNADSPCR